jgi:transcriptional regulator with XRE-family HTH domain
LDKNDLIDRFRSLRSKTNLSQKDFAQSIGLSQSVIAEIERGSREPSRSVLVAIAEKYQVSLDWLLLGVGSSDSVQCRENPEVEALKKEIALLEDKIRELEAENKKLSQELFVRMRQLIDIQSRQLGTT